MTVPVVAGLAIDNGRQAASIALEEGRFDEALRLLRRSAALDPADDATWQRIGAAFLAAERKEDSLRAYRRAALANPADAQLDEILAELALTLPSPDIRTAAWASNRLDAPCNTLALHWAKTAAAIFSAGQPEIAHASAWEALRLAGDIRTTHPFELCRQLADIDFAPSTAADAMVRQGYSAIPGTVTKGQAEALRRYALDTRSVTLSAANDQTPNALEHAPALIDIILQPEVLHPLRGWLGERPLLYPLSTSATRFFTSWHTDTAQLPGGGRTFSEGRSSLMLSMLLYLQDNRPFVGGGLDVALTTHQQLGTELSGPPRTIASGAGDLVVFDSRIVHRGSRHLMAGVDTRPKIFLSVQWFADADYGRRAMAAYAADSPPITIPFLDALVRRCEAVGVGVVTPPG